VIFEFYVAAHRIALRGGPLRLRRIAQRLATLAEEGNLAAIREIADRLDGKPAQVRDRRDPPIEELGQSGVLTVGAGGGENSPKSMFNLAISLRY
jgi:hypothetical protein